MITRRTFVAELINSFPELRQEIEVEDHRNDDFVRAFPNQKSIRVDRMACWFRRHTQSAIDTDHRDLTKAAIRPHGGP